VKKIMSKEIEKAHLELARQLGGNPLALEVARLIGSPINTGKPGAFSLDLICNIAKAEPGEKVFTYQAYDTVAGEVLAVNASTGAITVVKRSPVGDTELSFSGFSSKLEYILVDAILDASDQNLFARKKEVITDNLDKKELKLVLDACINASSGSFGSANIQTVSLDSGEDIFDVLIQAVHKLEDYGDGFVLIAGTTVKEQIDTYDKDFIGTNNYKADIEGWLRRKNIKVVKAFGTVVETDGGSASRILDAESFVMVATNSNLAEGKPIVFATRKITPALATLIGADVENAYRAVITNPAPVNNAGTNTWAYGVYAYEKIAVAIVNPLMICTGTNVVS
jgi:hypothetical protein